MCYINILEQTIANSVSRTLDFSNEGSQIWASLIKIIGLNNIFDPMWQFGGATLSTGRDMRLWERIKDWSYYPYSDAIKITCIFFIFPVYRIHCCSVVHMLYDIFGICWWCLGVEVATQTVFTNNGLFTIADGLFCELWFHSHYSS